MTAASHRRLFWDLGSRLKAWAVRSLVFGASLILLWLCVFVAPSASLRAQEVRGTVRDQSTGTPLENVLIRVDSVGAVTLTDDQGWFILRRLREGRYTVSFQTMGYDTVRVIVNVPADDPIEVSMPPRPIEIPGIEVSVECAVTTHRLRRW